MERIESLAQLSPLISAQWKKGVLTNAAFSAHAYEKEIGAGTLYAEEWPGALLLFRGREGFDRLNFYLQPGADLSRWQPERTTVLEIPFRDRDTALRECGPVWEQAGFRLQFSRLRLAHTGKTPPLTDDFPYPVRPAGEGDLPRITELMVAAYDPRTACLPTDGELREDTVNGGILVAEDGEQGVIGFSRILREGRGGQWRHLVVLPRYRGQGIAQRLFEVYDSTCDAGPIRVWVAEGNHAALKLYGKLGFTPDGWRSTVWICEKERN